MRLKVLIFLLLVLSGCATSPKFKPEPQVDEDAPPKIDYPLLQKNLNLDRGIRELGYDDKYFYTCKAGAGFSDSKDCHSTFLVVIHFQLLCRNSEGTVEYTLSHSDMAALARRTVRWNLLGMNGVVFTDDDGYAQIVTLSDKKAELQRLRLAVDADFLYMRAGEIRRVVTPQSWCNP